MILEKNVLPLQLLMHFLIGLQVVFFLDCDLEMYNQRISINAPMCDRLILLTSAPSEMMLHLLGNRKMWHEWGGCGHNSVTERKELLLLRTGHPGFTFLCEYTKSILDKRNSKYKSSEVGLCLMCSRTQRKFVCLKKMMGKIRKTEMSSREIPTGS